MQNSVNQNIKGLSRTLQQLGDLRTLPRKETNSALRKVAAPIVRNARKNLKANGNVKTGRLYKSIKKLVASRRYPGLMVGPTYRGKSDASAPHAHLLEFGTKQRKLKRPLLLNFNGTWALVTQTGKMKAQPYMEPAVEQSLTEIDRLSKMHITPLIEKQWGK
jgi:HK97 gp10 family phage protein